ncbi:retrovirus-related pol polyprotein from transposon TNT 1-94 [Tanacetum coccineum]
MEVKILKEHIKVPSDNSPSVSQTRSSKSSNAKKAPMIPKPFNDCKYYGFNDHHSDNYEYYPGCEICGSVAYETTDCPKKHPNSKKPRITAKRSTEPTKNGCSRHMTRVKQYLQRYSKESGPKVVFRDDSSGDTKGYGSVNCNGITFTRVAYVNGLKHNLININKYSRYTWVFYLKKKSNAADCIMSFIIKMENLNDITVNELRSDNGTEFRNHKLEESVMKKEYLRISHLLGEDVNTACYTQNRSIIVKRHGKTTYDVFRGRSLDTSHFHVFGCPVHIHNHRDHLGKFDEKTNDGFFLGYSLVAKAFRVYNIRRQKMEETVHVTFSEDDEAISQSNTEGDAINFNENRSFPNDEFFEPRSKVAQFPRNIEYFPYIPAYENITPTDSPIL